MNAYVNPSPTGQPAINLHHFPNFKQQELNESLKLVDGQVNRYTSPAHDYIDCTVRVLRIVR